MAAWTVGLQMAEVGGKEAARRKASWRHQQQEQSLAKEGSASCLGSSTSTSDGLSKLMDSREGCRPALAMERWQLEGPFGWTGTTWGGLGVG